MSRLILFALATVAVVNLVVADGRADKLADEQNGLAPPKANRGAPARERFQAARTYYVYYGSGKVAELSRFDAVILHTPQMASSDVKRLAALGVVTLGYLTIGQDHRLRDGDGRGPSGKASWYFDGDHDGHADRDPIWKSYYANPGVPQWRANRVEKAKRLIADYGFDGVFLDMISVSEMYPECRDGMVQMIHDLREALPQAVIVINQGFDIIATIAQLTDGIMMESFTSTYDFESRHYQLNSSEALDLHFGRATKVVNPAIENYQVKVLVLDYALPTDRAATQAAADRAASLGYLQATAPIMLDEIYSDLPPAQAANVRSDREPE